MNLNFNQSILLFMCSVPLIIFVIESTVPLPILFLSSEVHQHVNALIYNTQPHSEDDVQSSDGISFHCKIRCARSRRVLLCIPNIFAWQNFSRPIRAQSCRRWKFWGQKWQPGGEHLPPGSGRGGCALIGRADFRRRNAASRGSARSPVQNHPGLYSATHIYGFCFLFPAVCADKWTMIGVQPAWHDCDAAQNTYSCLSIIRFLQFLAAFKYE